MLFGEPALRECLELLVKRVPELSNNPLTGLMLYHGGECMCLIRSLSFGNIVVFPHRRIPYNPATVAFSRGVPYRAARSGERVLKKHLTRWEKSRLSFLAHIEEQDPCRKAPLTVVGEGNGSILAVFLTDELSAEGYNIQECLISKCPRIGNEAFLKGVETRNLIQCFGKVSWTSRFFRNKEFIPK
jgi:hypothetical protein